MATQIKIPFDENGEALHSDNTRWRRPPYEWRDNYIFNDTLQFIGFNNMGTSVQAKFKSLTDGKSYTMFLSELERCINIDVIHDRKIKGAFTFVKKGTNFSISYVVDG